MSAYKVFIQKPCHENWEAMTQEQQGKHCGVCCKTVIDFTNYTDQELITYFTEKNNNTDAICGSFSSKNVSTPYDTIYDFFASQTFLYEKYTQWTKTTTTAVLKKSLLLTFGFFLLGNPLVANAQVDSTPEIRLMGDIAIPASKTGEVQQVNLTPAPIKGKQMIMPPAAACSKPIRKKKKKVKTTHTPSYPVRIGKPLLPQPMKGLL